MVPNRAPGKHYWGLNTARAHLCFLPQSLHVCLLHFSLSLRASFFHMAESVFADTLHLYIYGFCDSEKKTCLTKARKRQSAREKKICIFSIVFKNNLTVLRKYIFFRFFIHCLYTENEIISLSFKTCNDKNNGSIRNFLFIQCFNNSLDFSPDLIKSIKTGVTIHLLGI